MFLFTTIDILIFWNKDSSIVPHTLYDQIFSVMYASEQSTLSTDLRSAFPASYTLSHPLEHKHKKRRSTDYDFSMPIPIIGGPKKPIPINWTIFILYFYVFVIMTITTILNEHLF